MFSDFLATVEFSLAVTGPIFVILGLGAWLRRIGLINEAFIEGGSRLVFNVTLPALLLISVAKTRLDTSANFALIGFGLAAASLYVGLVTILFNILSVVTLNNSLHARQGIGPVIHSVAANPLIIGIVLAAIGKLFAVPLLFVGGGILWGFRGIDLGIVMLMSLAPTAAASYVMVRAMGGNVPLAANSIP